MDNTNVETFPLQNLNDIAAMARRFADDLEADKYGDVQRVILIAENESGLNILGWGSHTTAYELMGMFEASKLRVFADSIEE